MTCEEFQARYLAGDLSIAERSHLASCGTCRSAAPGLDRLAQQLADPLLWESPSPQLADRVVAAVIAEARPLPAAPKRRWWIGAAAALTTLAVVAGALATGSRPDWEVELASTASAPRASANVAGWNTERGTRMQIDISDLAPAPDDTYYEIWLTAADGRHVSAGTFSGPGRVVVWAGVQRRDFPRIWITLEPADDDPSPSSVMVLDTAPDEA